ncbi:MULTISPECIES: tyrosine-type recombinase/integrase [Nocardia]|uniref:Site-specific integrase n=1 Tax=Nocardia coubleae TaxID=356147 RepID=A0A846WF99_9NOCA|nr:MULTISPECIES: tyrosine-type recombinase/integrase [Nocardia]NKX91267.1 site-specific integrase [Nocardia coubleae]
MLTEIAPGHWKARIYIRDTSGRRREVVRFSPIKLSAQGRPLPDRSGQRALDAVMAAAVAIRVDLDDELSDSITVKQLWDHYRDHLVSLGRAEGTLSRYDEAAKTFDSAFGGRRLFEVNTATVEAFLKDVGHARGPSNMRTARNVLSGMFRFACARTALAVNPVREARMAENVEAKGRTGGAGDLTVDELRFILSSVRTSQIPCPRKLSKAERERGTPVKAYTPPTVAAYCEGADLADVITLYAATGLRRSQMLGLVWSDIDLDEATLHPVGKVVRVAGKGLVRVTDDDDPKNHTGIMALPEFAVAMLKQRKDAMAARRKSSPPKPGVEDLDLVFASAVWTLRDPQNVGHAWQRVREALGFAEDITPHSFRHAVATILDDAGLSARVTADVLGHVDVAMTQRYYMARGRPHRTAANVLDRAIGSTPVDLDA